jgi:uncharacterized membrane protein YfcA
LLASLPVVQDPWFYAVAVPAVLITGLSKSGFASGFGSLATPMMALTLPVPQAAAIMLPLLLAMDATGLQQLWRERNRGLVRHLLPWALLGTVIGTLLFGVFSNAAVAGLVGALTLAFLAQRLLFPPRPDSPPPPTWLGALLTATSGFTSFIAHAGGPPINAYVIPLRLSPLLFTGTLAFFFFFINMAKWIPYAWLGLLDGRNMLTSLALLPFAPIGVWVGVRIAHRINPVLFYRLIYTGMFLTGVKLLWDAWR